MSRTAFLRGVALLGSAIGLAGLDLPALLRRTGTVPGPEPRPAAPAAITPPTRSVKRRG